MERPIRTIQTPHAPLAGEIAVRDPREFGRGFDTRQQPDIRRNKEILNDVGGRIANISDYLDYLAAYNLPPQLVQAPKGKLITAVNSPVLLVKKNQRRQGFKISNYAALAAQQAVILFSFDQPFPLDGTGQLAGIPIAINSFYEEVNGSVSINDIWVWTATAAGITFPIPVLGYEATLSIAGNPK